jgi:hypothetical protein
MSFVRSRDRVLPALAFAFALLGWIVAGAPPAAAAPFAWEEIALGAGFAQLAATLDLRDIEAELRAAQEKRAAKPDLGRRGYGCMRREDPFADVTCVSHSENAGGVPTREIRLHFLGGLLQQFSITVELSHRDALLSQLRQRYGVPTAEAPGKTGGATHQWRNGESRIDVYVGRDLVFVSFEAATYRPSVRRKQSGAAERP